MLVGRAYRGMEAEGIWLSPVDRAFVEKVMDVVGLYLDPPERALALSVGGAACSEAVPSPRPRSKTISMIHDLDDHDLDDHEFDNRNAGPKPLAWTVPAAAILEKVRRGRLAFESVPQNVAPPD